MLTGEEILSFLRCCKAMAKKKEAEEEQFI